MLSLKQMVENNQTVVFVRYQAGNLWYITESGFEFPVPVEDTGNAAFLPTDRAMLFMRWIRKHIQYIENSNV